MLTLFTDSDCDVTPEIASEYGYKLISMPYMIDGKEILPYVDFKIFDYHSFYNLLRDGVLPTTSGISPAKYIEYFEPEFIKGNDILYVHFSAAMTSTFNAMRLALEELKGKYPERKFYSIDTKGITICSLNIVKEIGDLHKQGKSIEDILKWSETEVDKFAIYFYADDLKFFARSGRVSGFNAIMGNVFNIHPIIYMDSDGVMKTHDKCRRKIQSLKKIIEYVDALQDHIKDHRVIIGHTDALQIAEQLGQLLRDKYGEDLKIEYVVVNPTAGSHCGPDGVGVCFHAKHR